MKKIIYHATFRGIMSVVLAYAMMTGGILLLMAMMTNGFKYIRDASEFAVFLTIPFGLATIFTIAEIYRKWQSSLGIDTDAKVIIKPNWRLKGPTIPYDGIDHVAWYSTPVEKLFHIGTIVLTSTKKDKNITIVNHDDGESPHRDDNSEEVHYYRITKTKINWVQNPQEVARDLRVFLKQAEYYT